MSLLIAGSIATDHLMSFPGKFSDSLVVDQLDKLVTLGNQRGVVAIGNVDVTIFERATREEIEAEVKRCLDTVGRRSRFVLSTSCELPPQANPDCVKWFMDAARDLGRWDRLRS